MNIGFNDYIAKPINKERLSEILNKLQTNKSNGKTISNENTEMENNNSKENLEYLKSNDIDVDASLELLGDIEIYNNTLKDFIEESKTRIPRIIKNKMSKNMKDYSIDVHAMKSDSKYLGFKKLAELSYNHELKSKENDYKYITLHFEELIDEYIRIKEVISKYL